MKPTRPQPRSSKRGGAEFGSPLHQSTSPRTSNDFTHRIRVNPQSSVVGYTRDSKTESPVRNRQGARQSLLGLRDRKSISRDQSIPRSRSTSPTAASRCRVRHMTPHPQAQQVVVRSVRHVTHSCSPRGVGNSPAPSDFHVVGVPAEPDTRIDDLVRAVMILREEMTRLREGNTAEFTIHANAIAAVREEVENAQPNDGSPNRRLSIAERTVAEFARQPERLREEFMKSMEELRFSIRENATATDRCSHHIREVQRSLEDLDALTERVETLERKDISRYVTRDGERISTTTQLMEECKSRVVDDVLAEFRIDVDGLSRRVRTIETNRELRDQIATCQEEVDGLKEQLDGIEVLQEDVDGLKDQIGQLGGIEALQEDVDGLKEQIGQLDGIEALQEDVDGLKEQIGQLGEIEALQEDVGGLKDKIGQLNRIEALQEDVDGLKEQIGQLDEIEALQEDVDGLKDQIGQLEGIDALQEDVDGLKEQIGQLNGIEALQEDVDGLKKQIGQLDGIEALQEDVGELKKQIGQLDGQDIKEDRWKNVQEELQSVHHQTSILDARLHALASKDGGEVADRMGQIEDNQARLSRQVKGIFSRRDTQLETAVENSRLALTELSQNISCLMRRVENESYTTATFQGQLLEFGDTLRTVQSQVSGLLSAKISKCPACEPPAAKPDKYVAVVAESLAHRRPLFLHPVGNAQWRYPVPHVPLTGKPHTACWSSEQVEPYHYSPYGPVRMHSAPHPVQTCTYEECIMESPAHVPRERS